MIAPERIWADPPSLFDGVDLWHEKQDGAELTAVEYIRKDASDAAIAAARAEGVREGMLKAAEIAGGMLINSYRADGVVEYRDFVAAAIRAAAEAQP
jgi:hypothetical protein